MDSVFDNIMNANENSEFTVKVSFLEIYNEKIQDLLDSKYLILVYLLIHFFLLAKKNNLAVKEDKNHGIFIQDATEVYVYNVDQMKKVMKAGAENRFLNKAIYIKHSLVLIVAL